jgi:RNA polymerase sigma factor (sigma-70 family)
MRENYLLKGPEEDKSFGKTSEIRSFFAFRTDEEVWRLFIRGDNKAFIYLYDKYFKILFRFGRQFTADKELIKDVIQDIFIDFRTPKYKVSDTTSVRFYLLVCLKNRLINRLKKEKKFINIDEGFDGLNFDFIISHEQNIIDMQLREEIIAKLNAAITKLTIRQKEAVYYLFYQNFSVDEIRKIMQLDHRRSVQNLIYKALGHLKSNLVFLFGLILYNLRFEW